MKRKALSLAVSAALAAPITAHAVKYKLSGQVNRVIAFQDDGVASDTQFLDNGITGTRWRILGSQDIGNGIKVGFNWEWQASPNPSTGAVIKSGDFGAVRGFTPDLRKAEVWFTGKWGKVSLGKGDGAGKNIVKIDLSGTDNVNWSDRASFGSAIAWRTGGGANVTSDGATQAHGTGGAAGSLTFGDTFDVWDSFGRNNRLRYDSPSLGPVTFSASVGQNELWDTALRGRSGLAGGQLSAGLFYGKNSTSKGRVGGGVSYLFSQGTNITFSAASNDPKNKVAGQKNALTWYVKLGHKWGNNAISAAYGKSEDVAVNALGQGFEDSGWQIGYNYNIPRAKVDVYAGYQSDELKTPAATPSVKDISVFIVGSRIKFD